MGLKVNTVAQRKEMDFEFRQTWLRHQLLPEPMVKSLANYVTSLTLIFLCKMGIVIATWHCECLTYKSLLPLMFCQLPPADHIVAPASLLGDRVALVTQTFRRFRQVGWLVLNSWGSGSGLP